MTAGIYEYTNKINRKKYVGKSKNLEQRHNNHRTYPYQNSHKNDCLLFYRAIRKYGFHNFEYKILIKYERILPSNKLFSKLERFFVKRMKSHKSQHGYNITWGGEGIYGFKHSEATKRKMSISMKANQPDRAGKNNSMYGKKRKRPLS